MENMENNKDRKLGIGAFILGFLAIVTCKVQLLAIVLAVAAIVLAVFQIRKNQYRGFAIAGIELAAIGFAYSFFVAIITEAIALVF